MPVLVWLGNSISICRHWFDGHVQKIQSVFKSFFKEWRFNIILIYWIKLSIFMIQYRITHRSVSKLHRLKKRKKEKFILCKRLFAWDAGFLKMGQCGSSAFGDLVLSFIMITWLAYTINKKKIHERGKIITIHHKPKEKQVLFMGYPKMGFSVPSQTTAHSYKLSTRKFHLGEGVESSNLKSKLSMRSFHFRWEKWGNHPT